VTIAIDQVKYHDRTHIHKVVLIICDLYPISMCIYKFSIGVSINSVNYLVKKAQISLEILRAALTLDSLFLFSFNSLVDTDLGSSPICPLVASCNA
jgi:hypothetical protein